GNSSAASAVGPSSSDAARAGALRASGGPNGGNSAKSGYIYAQNSAAAALGNDYFFYVSTSTATGNVTFPTFNPSTYSTLNASWLANSTSFGSGSVFFAIQLNGSAWYVTTTSYRTATSPSLDLLNLSWRSVTLSTAGADTLSYNTLSSSTSSALFGPSDSITGVGFYIDDMPVPPSGLVTYRIDDLLISDIPETSTSLLGLIGFSALAFRRKK
ncbi:MAG TPA: hypothetical protein VM511_07935, partial [Luteolibacter sp.]|nr:hypothetical protein [Luteolibacter sp.]